MSTRLPRRAEDSTEPIFSVGSSSVEKKDSSKASAAPPPPNDLSRISISSQTSCRPNAESATTKVAPCFRANVHTRCKVDRGELGAFQCTSTRSKKNENGGRQL